MGCIVLQMIWQAALLLVLEASSLPVSRAYHIKFLKISMSGTIAGLESHSMSHVEPVCQRKPLCNLLHIIASQRRDIACVQHPKQT